MKNNGLFIIFGIFLLIAIVGGSLVFLANKKEDASVQSTLSPSAVATPGPTSLPTDDETGVLELEVSGKEFSLSPAGLTINKGDQVKLTYKNEGAVPHDLVIDELNVRTSVIGPGQKETIEFMADDAGSFTFYCSVGNHRARGMEGKVEIK